MDRPPAAIQAAVDNMLVLSPGEMIEKQHFAGLEGLVNPGATSRGAEMLYLAQRVLRDYAWYRHRWPTAEEAKQMLTPWREGFPHLDDAAIWTAFAELEAYDTDYARNHGVDGDLAYDTLIFVLDHLLDLLVEEFRP